MAATLRPQRRRRTHVCLLLALWLGTTSALQAGQDCSARRPDAATLARDLDLAASVAAQLDALARREGVRAVLLARAGQDLSRYGVRYSHLGIAYRDPQALDGRGAWRVVHKLNQCGSSRSELRRQGLAEFFADGLYRPVAGVAVLDVLPVDAVARLRDNLTLTRLHEPRYNMLAYPWSGPYQQSNQWALETLALLDDPSLTSRYEARRWLRRQAYRPAVVHIGAIERLGASVASAHIRFDDQPFGQRLAGRIETVTVDSVFQWLGESQRGRVLPELRSQPLPRAIPSVPQPAAI